MRTICLGKIDHINGVREVLSSFSEVVCIPQITKNGLYNILGSDEKEFLFVVPNNLGFRIDAEILRVSNVVAIGTVSTGVDHIDLRYCEENNIKVFSLAGSSVVENITSTAEHAFALMMSLIRKIPSSFDSVKNANWNFVPFRGRQLNRMKVGIVGYGRLGKMFRRYCQSFGCSTFICDPFIPSMSSMDLEEIFKKCEIVSLHVNFNESTNKLINKKILSNGNGVYLINTSRGCVVDDEDIIWALKEGKLTGYATDVLSTELEDITKSVIWENSGRYNIIITPHVGGTTVEAQNITYQYIVNELKNYENTI